MAKKMLPPTPGVKLRIKSKSKGVLRLGKFGSKQKNQLS